MQKETSFQVNPFPSMSHFANGVMSTPGTSLALLDITCNMCVLP